MKVQGSGLFFCFGGRSCKNKGSLELSAPIPTHHSPAEHFHPSTRSGLKSRTHGFLRLKGWAGESLRSGVQIEKEGGHRSFEDSGTRRCIQMVRLGRATETQRLENSLGEKLPLGRQRMLPVHRWRQKILYKRRETHL